MNTKYNGDIISHNARVVKAGGVVESLDYTNFISEESKQISSDFFRIYNNPAFCYSLRRLNTAYKGPAIRVRRSSDNAELDIYYTLENELNLAVLTDFVGSGNSGFVVTWYDQSGTGKHLSNSTTSRQPLIINNGSLITNNGKPAIYFDGTDDHLFRDVAAGIDFLQNFCVCLVFRPALFGDNRTVFQTTLNTNNRFAIGLTSASSQVTSIHTKAGVTLNRSGTGTTNTTLVFANSYLELYLNNVLGTNTVGALSSNVTTINIGGTRAQSNFSFMTGSIQEIIMLQGKSTQLQINLQNNINSYYNIY